MAHDMPAAQCNLLPPPPSPPHPQHGAEIHVKTYNCAGVDGSKMRAMFIENLSWQNGLFSAGAGLLGWIAYVCLKQGLMSLKTRRIPSCNGFIPVIGHSFELLRDNVWKVFASMGASHGPVCKLFVMGQLYVVVSSPEAVKHVLMHPEIYHKDKGTYGFFKSLLGTGIVTAEGEHHQRLRRLVSNIMKNNILGDAAAYSHAATERLLQSLDAHLLSSAATQPVEIGEMLRLLTLQVIGTAVLGLEPEESNRELPQLYLPIIEECNDRVWFPPRMFLPTKSNIMFGRHVNQLNAFVVKQIEKRRDERSRPAFDKKAPPRDILDRFFEGYEDKLDSKVVLQVNWILKMHKARDSIVFVQLRDDLKTFLFAGHDTSATVSVTAPLHSVSPHVSSFSF
jgi:cytochrome P450